MDGRPTIDYATGVVQWDGPDDHTRYPARLVWFKSDPATVWLVIQAGETEIPWVISREMLVEAMSGRRSGLHEIVIEPSDDSVFGQVLLMHADTFDNETRQPGPHIHLLLPRPSVLVFLAQAKFIVPQQREYDVYASQMVMERFTK